jgi:hypothetical protein
MDEPAIRKRIRSMPQKRPLRETSRFESLNDANLVRDNPNVDLGKSLLQNLPEVAKKLRVYPGYSA